MTRVSNHQPEAAARSVEVEAAEAEFRVTLGGPLVVDTITPVAAALGRLPPDRRLALAIGRVTRLDTAGAWAICRLTARFEAAGQDVTLSGGRAEQRDLIAAVAAAMPSATEPAPRGSLVARLDHLGRAVAQAATSVVELTGYLGLFLARLGATLVRPRRFPATPLVHHCEEVGLNAVPIVALMAFLIGVVLAFQGATQLRQFGAEVFVVDLIAISVLRELGILLTAIIVAGRTASAFTAAIGSMKMREEIDAMRTLSIDPAMALMLPRVLALLITLPILGLVANLMGLLGGGLMAWLDLGISPAMFRTRLVEGTSAAHVLVGMIKAPFFAVIIGLIGCHAGMRVGGDAESLGRMTSAAVVAAIFAVIVADALFSIFFAQVGL